MISAKDALQRTKEQRIVLQAEAKAKAERDKQYWLDTNKCLVKDSLKFIEDCIEKCISEGIDFELFGFSDGASWKKIEEEAKHNYRFTAPWLQSYYVCKTKHNIELYDYVIRPALYEAGYKLRAEHRDDWLTVRVSWDD